MVDSMLREKMANREHEMLTKMSKIGVLVLLFCVSISQADYISGVTATADSQIGTWVGATHTVDGLGWQVYGVGTHTTVRDGYMWLTNTWAINSQTANITFDLGATYDVASTDVWNLNANITRGAKDVTISVSADNSTWTSLGNFVFTQGPGSQAAFTQTIALNAENIRYIKFHVTSNYGDTQGYAGLSEVRFTAVPEPVTLSVLCSGFLGYILKKRRSKIS